MTDLVARLSAAASVSGPAVVSARRHFLDTFDWRLFNAGYQLECVHSRGATRLRLTRRDSGVDDVEVELRSIPQSASDLPRGALRERLASLTGGRALIRRTDEALRLWQGEMSNRRGKVVARLEVTGAPRRQGAIAVVRGVRGFGKWSRRLSRCLGKNLGGRPWHGDRLLIASTDAGVAPGDHPRWRLTTPLDPVMRTDAALVSVLGHYTEIMALNLDGVRGALDPEFLHDFRIGIRRIRTLLKRVPGVFADTPTSQFLADFAWLSARTSPVRDLDVYALDFPRHLQRLNDVHAEDLAPFIEEVALRRERAQCVLTADLNSARFKRRFTAWQRFLERPLPKAPRRDNAMRSIEETAHRTLAAVARKLYRQGDAITPDSPAESYHTLRKVGKNLRYLYDAYESLLSRKHVSDVRARLKELQDVLGTHQDREVQAEVCAAYAGSLDPSTPEHARTRDAASELARHLNEESIEARKHFAEHYAPFRRLKLHKRPGGQ